MVRKLLLIALLIVLMSACGKRQTPPPEADKVFNLIAVIPDGSCGTTRVYRAIVGMQVVLVAANCDGVSITAR